ncbi:MAG: hypothetical protein M1473_04690 [Firmicutes bacterium]|nr:hypothetical protein [Bacillota bacterium]
MANDGYDSPSDDGSTGNDAPPPEYYATNAPQTDAENSIAMVLSVWWSFTWRFVALFLVVSFVVGMILALATGGDVTAAERWGSIISVIAGIPIGIWSIGKALSVKHKGLNIVFIRKPAE